MLQYKLLIAAALLLCYLHVAKGFEEEDWGDGLRVLTTYRPESCEHKTKKSDTIHYHYVGRLAEDGSVFGKSFDYDSPYIVSLGHARIIPGMDRGLVGMCLWERRRITFPPHLGYGERGVGQVIPPNATLVFYVRLIKIERNGHALGEDPGIEGLWKSGLQSYNEEKWQQVVDMVEEALRLFYLYQDKSYHCIKDCREEGSDFKLSKKERETVDKFSSTDPLVEQFLVYAARGKCIRECKANALTPKLRSPDPAVIKDFKKQRVPYTYLHFSYYKLDNLNEGARCMFSYYFRHPEDDLAIGNAVFYREQLGLGEEEFVWREEAPGTLPHMDAYLAGRKAYTEEKWLQAADHFEQALSLYPEALERCQLLCEDMMNVNLTHRDMSPEKKAKFEQYEFVPDTMEYYPLMVTIVKELLQCRVGCHAEMASNNLEAVEDHLSLHFHYLQFCYYKLGQIPKAAEAAATHQLMDPSNEQMAANIQFYTKTYKLQPDAFTPRQKFVDILEKLETEKKLLHFAEHGQLKRRDGQRGDSQAQRQPPKKHNEL